jgi:hypothetical protein
MLLAGLAPRLTINKVSSAPQLGVIEGASGVSLSPVAVCTSGTPP